MSKKGTAKKMFSKILGRIEILRRLDLRSMVGKYYQHALTILILVRTKGRRYYRMALEWAFPRRS